MIVRKGCRAGWVGCLFILLGFFSFSPLKAELSEEWRERRSSLLEEIVTLLRQSNQDRHADSLLTVLEYEAIQQNDSVALIKAYTARINAHINNESYVDSLLDKMGPLLPAGDFTDSVEYFIDRAFAAGIRGEYQVQIAHLDTACQIAEEFGSISSRFYTQTERSLAFQNVDNFEAALNAGLIAMSYHDSLNDPSLHAYSLRNLGYCYASLGNLDSAVFYYEGAYAGYSEVGNMPDAMYSWALIGKTYYDDGNISEALPFLESARDSLLTNPENGVLIEAYHEIWTWLAESYLALGKIRQAREAAKTSLEIADSLNKAHERIQALKILIRAELNDEPEVQGYFEEFVRSQTKLSADENQRAILEYERKYQANLAEKQVLELKQQAQDREISYQNTRFLVFVLLAVIVVAGLFAGVWTLRSRIRFQQRINELNLRALQLQINPHFFFNVLNSISNYIGRNDRKSAYFYLTKFARLMRLSLEYSRERLVELSKETDFLKTYLELEQLRSNQFEYEIDLPEDLRGTMVPPLMLQPFAENAVVHAFPKELPHPGKIKIAARKNDGFLELMIEDNGTGIKEKTDVDKQAEKTSLAIKILEERLQVYGKKRGGLRFEVPFPEQKEAPGTRVVLQIPLN